MSLSPSLALGELMGRHSTDSSQWFPRDDSLGAVLEGLPDPMEGQGEWVTADGESVADVREGYAELEKPEPLGRQRKSWPGVGGPEALSC